MKRKNMTIARKLKYLLLTIALWHTQIYAESQMEQCNKVLEGDLFNKISSNTSDESSLNQLAWQKYLSMNEQEAYNSYKRQYESSKEQDTGGSGSYAGISLAGHHKYGRKLEENEFSEVYNKMKSLNSGSSLFQSNARTAHVSNLSVQTRDEASIKAWETCVSKDPQPGLYAYGSRDEAGNPFLKVIWAPGNFAGIAPSVNVDFVAPPGVAVKAEKDIRVSVGGGKAFAATTNEVEKAVEVYVNASVPDPRLAFNDTQKAVIPPKHLPELKFPENVVIPSVLVPNLVGKPTVLAEVLLRKAGLVPKKLIDDSTVTLSVINQDPPSGTHVSHGSIVQLTTGKDPGVRHLRGTHH